MERARRDTMLGLVFFGGLALLLWATANLTNLSLTPKQELVVFFRNAGGLRQGDSIYVLGKRNGQVMEINLRPDSRDYRVRVRMQLTEPVTLKEDARIQIVDSNFLGGKQIEIDPGTGDRVLPPEQGLHGTTTPNAFEALGEMLTGADNKQNLREALRGINDLFRKLNDPSGSIGAMVYKGDLYNEFLAAATSLRATIQSVEKGDGTIARLVHDTQLADDTAGAVHAMRSIMEKVDTGKGLLADMLNSDQLAGSVRSAIEDVRVMLADLRAGKGGVGRLLRNEQVADKIQETVASLASVVAKADDPRAGTLGALLGDAHLRQDLVDIGDNIADVTRTVRSGKGLLGMLVYDDTVAEKMKRILNQVSRAIEDAREAAPVGTFIQVLGGVF